MFFFQSAFFFERFFVKYQHNVIISLIHYVRFGWILMSLAAVLASFEVVCWIYFVIGLREMREALTETSGWKLKTSRFQPVILLHEYEANLA